jgi:hypothetical protein
MAATTTRTGGPKQRGSVQDWHVLQRSLPNRPVSEHLARMTVRVACRAWRVPHAEESAALLAAELVSLVVRHAGPGMFTIRVSMTPRRLRLEVHDPSGALPPDLERSDPDAVAVIRASSHRWGRANQTAGAQVWAELAL